MITQEQILFEDNYLLALNKPQGIITEFDTRFPVSLQALALRYLQAKEKYPEKCFTGLPHRLDRPVSGVVLFAKKKSVLKALSLLFEQRAIEKTYYAVVEKCPDKQTDELIHWLVKDLKQRKAILHTKAVNGAVRVVLSYSCVAENSSGVLLRIRLVTGKFHQIRAQMAGIGCPVAGDTLYGATRQYKENAIALHAGMLQLAHPITQEQLTIRAPFPDDNLWNVYPAIF